MTAVSTILINMKNALVIISNQDSMPIKKCSKNNLELQTASLIFLTMGVT